MCKSAIEVRSDDHLVLGIFYTYTVCLKKVILSETRFYEPYRASLELVTELFGLSYYTKVLQGTIGPSFV